MPFALKTISIIGRGVLGLATGIRLLEAGFAVDIISRDQPADTTSMRAGAFWWPYHAQPLQEAIRWSKVSYNYYQKLQSNPHNGISFQNCFRYCEEHDDTEAILQNVEEWEEISPTLENETVFKAYRIKLPIIDVPQFMPFIEDHFLRLGGTITKRSIESPKDLLNEYDVVVNCSGVNAYNLVKDKKVRPISGQIICVSKPKGISDALHVFLGKNHFTMILPRKDDCVLGGTAIEGDWDTTPKAAITEAILNRCYQMQPLLRNSDILNEVVGLRPGRDEVRLEIEKVNSTQAIIHNYGHGGAGYTLAWGCADDVLMLVKNFYKI